VAKLALKILCGLCLFCECVYLSLNSNLLDLIEGTNLDGSVSITWRSGLVSILLLAACQAISFAAFRRRLAVATLAGLATATLSCYWLSRSGLGFIWEPHDSEGFGPITWRSDLVLLVLVSTFLALSFLVRWAIGRWTQRRAAAGPVSRSI